MGKKNVLYNRQAPSFANEEEYDHDHEEEVEEEVGEENDDICEDEEQMEQLSRNVSMITESQKLEVLKTHAPELVGIVHDLKEKIKELRERVIPIRAMVIQIVSASEDVDDDIVDYLKVKQQMLLSYCISLTFYLYMKVQGQQIRDHPVMRQLLELRYAMEKMRGLDGKLKHQIDRLMKQSTDVTSSLRPNPAAMVPRDHSDDDDNDDSEEEDDDDDDEVGGSSHRSNHTRNNQGETKKNAVYKASKMAAMPYHENEKEADKRLERMQRQRKKLNNSEIMETLREEFGSAPETTSSSGMSKINLQQRQLVEEADERRGFEEERFVRMTMSRKEKQSIKKRSMEASRLDNFDDFGDVEGLEQFMEMSRGSKRNGNDRLMGGDDDGNDTRFNASKSGGISIGAGAVDTAKALQRAVNAFSKGNKQQTNSQTTVKNTNSRPSLSAMEDHDDEDDDAYMNNGMSSGKNNKKRGRGTSSSFSSSEWTDRNDDMNTYGGDDMDRGQGLGQGRGAKHGRKDSGSGGGSGRSNTTNSVLSEFVREKKNERKKSIRN